MTYLRATEITKTYANHKALDRVTLEVPEKSIFGLLGPNGAGKTTLIRIINMITRPDTGEVFIDGHPLTREDIGNIGYMPEERGIYKKMKVGEQAIYLARLKGLSRADAMKKLKFWFDRLEIGSWWNRKVEELSKGMQQKVQFIVTILHEPKLLIFDEPFSGFDPINVNILKDEIRYLNEQGATIIFSTHNMASVEEICDHITLIDNSRNVLSGEIHAIKDQFKTHTFNLTYKSEKKLSELLNETQYRITKQQKLRENYSADIQLLNGSTTNNLLTKLLPEVEVIAMQEILPSLNDIFIEVVNKNSYSHE
jgi:ABC-2 type transport system ATP-binding protein